MKKNLLITAAAVTLAIFAIFNDATAIAGEPTGWCTDSSGNSFRCDDRPEVKDPATLCRMGYRPSIEQAMPLRRYSARTYEATLFGNIVSVGRVEYLYVLEVTRSDTPCLYVASEVNAFSPPGKGPYFLGVFPGKGHNNHGLSDDWGDLDLFEAKALELVLQYLNVELVRNEKLQHQSTLTLEEIDKEVLQKKLVDLVLQWVDLRRKIVNLKGAKIEETAVQAERITEEMQKIIEQLRPDFASPPRASQIEVNQYVLSLVGKYKPEKESTLRDEFNLLSAEQTQSLLYILKAGLENYLLDNGMFPKSGNINLSMKLARGSTEGYIRLPKTFFDKEGRILDFWGRPIVYKLISPTDYVIYSVGPNGKDEGGKGDDLAVSR